MSHVSAHRQGTTTTISTDLVSAHGKGTLAEAEQWVADNPGGHVTIHTDLRHSPGPMMDDVFPEGALGGTLGLIGGGIAGAVALRSAGQGPLGAAVGAALGAILGATIQRSL